MNFMREGVMIIINLSWWLALIIVLALVIAGYLMGRLSARPEIVNPYLPMSQEVKKEGVGAVEPYEEDILENSLNRGGEE